MTDHRSEADRFVILDGLRGVAAMLVLVSHCANHGWLPRILGHGVGQMGVMLFFVLSGFLMTHLYIEQQFDRAHVARYARNRIGRVLPLYLLLVAISLVPPPLPRAFAVQGHVLEHLLLLRGVDTLWTIPVELHFYLAFVGLWWAQTRGALWLAVAAVGVVMIALASVLASRGVHWTLLPFWAHFFLFGVVAARIRQRWHPQIGEARGQWIGWGACLLFVAAFPELRRLARIPVLENFADPMTMMAPALLFVAALTAAGPLRWLAAQPLRWLGAVSYGVYLFHYPVLKLVHRTLSPDTAIERAAAVGIVVIATIALAWLSHRWFELPAQRLVRSKVTFSQAAA